LPPSLCPDRDLILAVLRIAENAARDFEAAWLRVPAILLLAGFGAGLAYAWFVAWLERSHP
jgi:hypothetical protein